MRILPDIIRDSLRQYRHMRAFAYKNGFRTETWTYHEFYTQCKKISTLFSQNKVRKGDKILVYAPNNLWYSAIFFACAMSGVILVPIDFNSKIDFVKRVQAIVKAKFLFTVRTSGKTGIRTVFLEDLAELLSSKPAHKPIVTIAKDDPFEIVYTSGTTGNPKGVTITHGNLVANLEALRSVMPLQKSQVFLSILPLSHLLEQTLGLLAPISYGATIVYLPTKSSSALIEALEQHKVDIMVAVPIFLKLLRNNILRDAERIGKIKQLNVMLTASEIVPLFARRLLFRAIHKKLGGKLKFFIVGGAPLEKDIEMFWERIGVRILQGYGLTETAPVVSCNTFSKHNIGSVGQLLPGVQTKLKSDGEILVKGPNVTKGYYKNKTATNEVFENGWFKTGDIGSFNRQGFLFIKGRKKNMILTESGQNVYPEDIEEVLNREHCVEDSCVVQVGNQIVGAILITKNVNPEDLLDVVNDQLSSTQQLHKIVKWPDDNFPRTPTHKIRRMDVEARLMGERNTSQRTISEDKLIHILQGMSRITKINNHANLVKDLHLSSLDRVELITVIEEQFGVELDETVINDKTTVASLRKAIETHKSEIKQLPFHKWTLKPTIILIRIGLQAVLFSLIRIFARIEYEGQEHLENIVEPVIFMSNHTSHLDTPAILAGLPGRIRRRTAVAAAMDYFFENHGINKKLYSLFVSLFLNAYPFSRNKTSFILKSLNYSGALLDNGFSILIYPEGTRNSTHNLGMFKTGTGLMAVKMRTPIVPIRVRNLDAILPKGAGFPKFGKARVTFGRPAYVHAESYISATNKIKQQVESL